MAKHSEDEEHRALTRQILRWGLSAVVGVAALVYLASFYKQQQAVDRIEEHFRSEPIEQLVAEYRVAPDGKLIVTDTISLAAKGERIKRGIGRPFPKKRTTKGGVELVLDYQPLQFLINDETFPVPVAEARGPGVVFWTGLPEDAEPLTAGRYRFTFQYEVSGAIHTVNGNEGFEGIVFGPAITHTEQTKALVFPPTLIPSSSLEVHATILQHYEPDLPGDKESVVVKLFEPTDTTGNQPERHTQIIAQRPLIAGEYLFFEIFWPSTSIEP